MYDVAFQGALAAFAEEAALTLVGPTARTLPCRRLADAFDAVELGAAAFAAVPIENSLAGPVLPSYDLLGARPIAIAGEVVLAVSHALIAPRGVALADVRRVLSHPTALAQCEDFFRRHPNLEPAAAYNTAGALQEIIASGARDAAAIASKRAAEVHGGDVLLERLEDDPQNFTRFLFLARPGTALPPGRWSSARKTSILLTLSHRPGTLAAALAVFAERAIDLSKIESRPLRGKPFEYAFFIDLAGDFDDPGLKGALAALTLKTSTLRLLGSYAQLDPR